MIGTGTVARWVLEAIRRERLRLQDTYGLKFLVVAIANRSGVSARHDGHDLARISALLDAGESLAALEGARHFPTALEALSELDIDVLAEVSQSPATDGEPGLSHMRTAIEGGIAVATSNKWPVALAGLELAALAGGKGVGFRAESTVMSGTPLLSAFVEGLGGAKPVRLRGILNATVNYVCSRMAEGSTYEAALRAAQEQGLAERDPSADMDGLDSAAKVMVLSALVFGEQLRLDDVSRRGISELAPGEVEEALAAGRRIREVSRLDPATRTFSVTATALEDSDSLIGIEDTMNCATLEVEPLGAVTVIGPGAGPQLAGQGVFSDLIRLAQRVSA